MAANLSLAGVPAALFKARTKQRCLAGPLFTQRIHKVQFAPAENSVEVRRGSASRSSCTCGAGPAVQQETAPRESTAASEIARDLVIAVDESQDALRAFNWAIAHLYRSGDVLHILHILPFVDSRPASGQVFYTPPVDQGLEDIMVEQAKIFIQDNFVAEAERRGVKYQVDVIKGSCLQSTGQAICEAADKLKAAMLIVHTHQKSIVEELLMGSVSHYCANYCKRPTLVLR